MEDHIYDEVCVDDDDDGVQGFHFPLLSIDELGLAVTVARARDCMQISNALNKCLYACEAVRLFLLDLT